VDRTGIVYAAALRQIMNDQAYSHQMIDAVAADDRNSKIGVVLACTG